VSFLGIATTLVLALGYILKEISRLLEVKNLINVCGEKRIDVKIYSFMFSYLKSLIRTNSGDSSKAFGLVCSVIVGSFIGVVIGVILLYDGLSDGTLDSDLWMVGWFLFCDSVFIFGGGLSKTLTDKWFEGIKKKKGGEV